MLINQRMFTRVIISQLMSPNSKFTGYCTQFCHSESVTQDPSLQMHSNNPCVHFLSIAVGQMSASILQAIVTITHVERVHFLSIAVGQMSASILQAIVTITHVERVHFLYSCWPNVSQYPTGHSHNNPCGKSSFPL